MDSSRQNRCLSPFFLGGGGPSAPGGGLPCWGPGHRALCPSPCEQTAGAWGGPPPQMHTRGRWAARAVAPVGHRPIPCAVVTHGCPGTGSSTVAAVGWLDAGGGPADPRRRGEPQGGHRSGWPEQVGWHQGWRVGSQNLLGFSEHQESSSSLHLTPLSHCGATGRQRSSGVCGSPRPPNYLQAVWAVREEPPLAAGHGGGCPPWRGA